MTTLVELAEVRKRYDGAGGRTALDGVDLAVDSGEFTAIMGPSGSGKSTLLNLVAGADRPSAGRVTVGGQELGRLSEARLARFRRARIGFVFQFFNLLANLTVLDNVLLPAQLQGTRPATARARAMHLMTELDIGSDADADADADAYAAALRAAEPDFLTVAVNHTATDSTVDLVNAMARVLALVLGLIAAVGVFSTMLLHVRERTRDNAILRAVGMTPGQLLVTVVTASAVLGLIGGFAGMPAGVLTYHGLVSELALQVGNDLPPHAFDVLHPATLYPLGLTGLAIALVGALPPARRAARSRIAAILRSE